MIRTLVLVGVMVLPAVAADVSLTGKWKTDFEQALYCDKLAPAKITGFQFEILDAPYLNRSASSFDFKDANVTGTVTMTVMVPNSHPSTVISGLIIGQIVKNAQSTSSGKTDGLTLEGYIVSREQYGAWVEHKSKTPPANAGEVELRISGSAIGGYTLTGVVRSADTCSPVPPFTGAIQKETGNFGRGVPVTWSARVTLKKQ
jgi:hypothetical protein